MFCLVFIVMILGFPCGLDMFLDLCIQGFAFRASVAAYTGRHFGDGLSEEVFMLIFAECLAQLR